MSLSRCTKLMHRLELTRSNDYQWCQLCLFPPNLAFIHSSKHSKWVKNLALFAFSFRQMPLSLHTFACQRYLRSSLKAGNENLLSRAVFLQKHFLFIFFLSFFWLSATDGRPKHLRKASYGFIALPFTNNTQVYTIYTLDELIIY